MKRIATLLTTIFLILITSACTSEYHPDDIKMSAEGLFVTSKSEKPLHGILVIQEENGAGGTFSFNNGVPEGKVEIKDPAGETLLKTNLALNTKSKNPFQNHQATFFNMMLKGMSVSPKTKDFMGIFSTWSKFDGDYYKKETNGEYTEGTYILGQKIGLWREYCANDQLKTESTYFLPENEPRLNTLPKTGKELIYSCSGELILSAFRDESGKLNGEYVKNNLVTNSQGSNITANLLVPISRHNYIDDKKEGLQKDYNDNGFIAAETEYKNGVKHGLEKIYWAHQNRYDLFSSSSLSITKKEDNGLRFEKNYHANQLHGAYRAYDAKQNIITTGEYHDGKEVGLWRQYKETNGTYQLTDHNKNNFILSDKLKGFAEACHLHYRQHYQHKWLSRTAISTHNCLYYLENSVVDINKKISLGHSRKFSGSSNWNYPVMTAPHNIYLLMRAHGANTQVSDSEGRTRLHLCVDQMGRRSWQNRLMCSVEEAKQYFGDVDLNQVSNTGTVFHTIAHERLDKYRHTKKSIKEKYKLALALLQAGADINQLDNLNRTPLMIAISHKDYELANLFLDYGSIATGTDKQGRSSIFYFFTNLSGKKLHAKISSSGIKVLARMLANNANINQTLEDGRTIKDIFEESNAIYHIEAIRSAELMQSDFLKQAPLSQPQESPTKTTSSPQLETVDTSSIAENNTVMPTASNQAESTPNAQTKLPNLVNLTESSTAIDQQKQLENQIALLSTQAEEHIRASRLQTPVENSATGMLNQIKAINPDSPEVPRIENAIGTKYIELAKSQADKGNSSQAQKYITAAKKFIPDNSQMTNHEAEITRRLKDSEQRRTSSTSPTLNCEPILQAKGIPFIGRTLTASQVFSLSEKHIYRRALTYVKKNFSNVVGNNFSQINFQQNLKGDRNISSTLTINKSNGLNQIKWETKIPTGALVKKGDLKNAFCELVQSL